MDTVWWTKVTNASHFLDTIVDTMQSGQSIILHLPNTVPWYMTMQNIVETELIRQNSTSAYKYIVDNGNDPGEYLFNEFCKKEKRVHYRPGIGYADFLAKSDDIVLKNSILWISQVQVEQAKKWYTFIENYNKALGKKKRGCIFLVETRGEVKCQDKKGIKNIYYSKKIEHYDNYIFNMLAVSGLAEQDSFKHYLAEAVSSILPEDVELSSICIAQGRNFLKDSFAVIQNIVECKSRSDGSRFEVNTSESEMQERLWEAQIKTIFPLVEKQRNSIVQRYHREIEALLPISTAYGEVFEEAGDVEIGTISYLAGSEKIQMSRDDVYRVSKLKNARNVLAHIRTLLQEEVDEVFAL